MRLHSCPCRPHASVKCSSFLSPRSASKERPRALKLEPRRVSALSADLSPKCPSDRNNRGTPEKPRGNEQTPRRATGFLSGSEELAVRGSGTHPLYLGVGYATNLPKGTYSGNAVDAFLLQAIGVGVYGNDEPLLHDAVLPARGLPYQVGTSETGADFIVGDGRSESPAALLRIEAGVELRFRGSSSVLGQLLVQGKGVGATSAPQGALVVEGTAEAPVVFTSMNPAPAAGDWQGLYFETLVDERTRIDHAEIRFAGGESLTVGVCVASPGATDSHADCSAVLYLETPPPSAFIQSTLFDTSAGCGVYRGWSGDDVNFVAGNTFTGLAGCEQSNVPTDNNDCSNGACK